MDLEKITREACKAALEAGAFIKEQSYKTAQIVIEEKERNSLVSYVDKTAEKLLVEALSKLIPGCGFITEESTVKNEQKEYTWIIDPLDGTTNFLWSLPVFSVSVGLKRADKLVMGIVYEINRDELFFAHAESQALLNNKQIKVSARKTLSNSLLATGFPYMDHGQMEPYLNSMRQLMNGTLGLRRLGSAAVDLAYVACGRCDGFFEYALNPWDLAGGAVIIQQAGGTVTDFKGGDDYLFGKHLIATNTLIHEELRKILQGNFEKLIG